MMMIIEKLLGRRLWRRVRRAAAWLTLPLAILADVTCMLLGRVMPDADLLSWPMTYVYCLMTIACISSAISLVLRPAKEYGPVHHDGFNNTTLNGTTFTGPEPVWSSCMEVHMGIPSAIAAIVKSVSLFSLGVTALLAQCCTASGHRPVLLGLGSWFGLLGWLVLG